MHTPQALALTGPTASGKTGLALRLAEHLPCEIISMDSALVYRDMDIGTAKPTAAERAAVPHHLIDTVSPLEHYSAADFTADCVRLVSDIRARGRLPLIVGGTMMYYHALTQGLNTLPQADDTVRARLQQEKAQHGTAGLYRRLQQADPDTAERLQPQDTQRIERALEVWLVTGIPLSRHLAAPRGTPPLRPAALALIPADRALLHRKIEARFSAMLADGLIDEVRLLQQRYPALTAQMPSMRCVGYRQVWNYLTDGTDRAGLLEQGSAATRQLAKRQLTWLRKTPADAVCDPFDGDSAFQAALRLAGQIAQQL